MSKVILVLGLIICGLGIYNLVTDVGFDAWVTATTFCEKSFKRVDIDAYNDCVRIATDDYNDKSVFYYEFFGGLILVLVSGSYVLDDRFYHRVINDNLGE